MKQKMQEILDINPTINVLESEYSRLLGYPADHKIDDRAKELIKLTRNWYAQNGRPWVYARPSERFEILENSFKIDGIEFHSKYLHNQLRKANAEMVMLVAVSAGPQCEKQAYSLWKEYKPDEYFFMEMYGSAVVEHLIATSGAQFCAWADQEKMAVLPHYSPGYSGWDVAEQKTLMSLIEQNINIKFPEDISVMVSGMLNPKKSLLAIFGITKDMRLTQDLKKLIPCENCSLINCNYRRAKFKHSMRLIEDVSKLQPKVFDRTQAKKDILDTNASYSLNAKALKKWSASRLKIIENGNGSLDVYFRYEGSTCSNMGYPIIYDYNIKLDSVDRNYTVLDLSCAPADDDIGHTKMCTYIKNPEKFTTVINEEKPLLGQPLNNILSWERANRPSGCYCDKSSRYYKWGIVLEVIHYALVQKTVNNEQFSMINDQ